MKGFISNALVLTLLYALSNGVSAETPSTARRRVSGKAKVILAKILAQ